MILAKAVAVAKKPSGAKDYIDRFMKDDPPQMLPASATKPQGVGLNPEQLDVTQGNLLKVLIDK